ncbi:MAG TPA: hypothetical protein VG167_08800 [Verrucomicrobiae bacterium]|nr:hypothetical protein [Verrucomicrobiae bacterium]
MNRTHTLFLALILEILGGAGLASTVTAETLPLAALTGLKRQSDSLRRIYVVYSETQAGSDVPDYYGGSTLQTAYFDDERFYVLSRLHYKQEDEYQTNEYAYDGTYFYSGNKSYHMLVKYLPTDDSDPQRLDAIYIHYFAEAGFYVPQSIQEASKSGDIESLVLHCLETGHLISAEERDGQLRVAIEIPDPEVVNAQAIDLERERQRLSKLRNGPSYAEQRIAELRLMQTMPPRRKVVFWLDPARGYGVVAREEYTASEQLILRVTAADWLQFTDVGVWLPQTCTASYYADRFALRNFSDTTRLTVTYRVRHMDFSSHEGIVFDLGKTYVLPGTQVFDRSTLLARARPDHAVVYHVAADGRLLGGAAIKASSEMGRRSIYVFVALIVLLSLPPVLVFVRHRRSRGQTTHGVILAGFVTALLGGPFHGVAAAFASDPEKEHRVDEVLGPWQTISRWRIEYETKPLLSAGDISPTHQVTAAAAPGEFHHLGAHSAPQPWQLDPLCQAMFIHHSVGCNQWPNQRMFSENVMRPGQFLPASTVQDLMVLMTLAWPLTEYEVPADIDGRLVVPAKALRSAHYRMLREPEVVGGRECEVFDFDGLDTLWVSRGAAGPCVMKREFRSRHSGRLIRRTVVERSINVGTGLCLPADMRCEVFAVGTGTNQIIEREIEVKLVDWKFNDQVPDSEFVAVHRAGALKYVGSRATQVSAGGRDLLDGIVAFMVEYLHLPNKGSLLTRPTLWLVAGLVCGLMATCLVPPLRSGVSNLRRDPGHSGIETPNKEGASQP